MTLAHPTITISDLQALLAASPGQAIPATVIDMGRGGGQPYRLVWLRQPDGSQRLYRLVPETPHQTPTPGDTSP